MVLVSVIIAIGIYRGNPILSMPPSSSGGTTLLEMLNILETFPAQLGREGSVEESHHMIEAMRRAYRDRAEYSADPGYFPVPIELLTSKDHARELAGSIQPNREAPFLIGLGLPPLDRWQRARF